MIGMGAYPWMQFLGGGAQFPPQEPEAMRRTAAVGLTLWEGFLPETPEHANALRAAAEETGLRCVSSYVNARLHEADWPDRVEQVVARVERLVPLGLRVLVVNPEPIDWREPLDKDDPQLRTQAGAVQALGERLKGMGVRLAYHTHSPEMRQAAREFHHTLRATDPAAVGLCLDAHWIYRGAGNSRVALEDIVGMYADRVASLHLRQSQGGVWSESFTAEGDIDYPAIVATLRAAGFDGPVVLEQAREQGTPQAIAFDEALSKSREAAESLSIGSQPAKPSADDRLPMPPIRSYGSWSLDARQRWIDAGNAFGAHLFGNVRGGALRALARRYPDGRPPAEEAVDAALWEFMALLDGSLRNPLGPGYSAEYALSVRVRGEDGMTGEAVELAPNGDGLGLGYAGWINGDFGQTRWTTDSAPSGSEDKNENA